MTNKIEDILDEALDQLKSGASLEAVLFNFAEYKTELLPLLEIIQPGTKLPLKAVPAPSLQRKYLRVQPEITLWNKYLSLTKLALMPLSLLLVFCAAFTAQANPGQTLLYGFKQAVQKAPLAFIRNPDVRAAKEIELSEKTLNETEAFLSSNTDSSTQASVVANLTKQTSETLASVKDVAKENAISGKNSELLNKLVVIAQKQDQLVNAVKTTQDQPEASTTLTQGKNESTKTIAEVNNLVATVNEQVLANLKEVTPEPKVKGAETTKPAVTEKPKTEKTVSHTTSPAADSETAADPNQTDDSGQVSGNFILEYPTDQ